MTVSLTPAQRWGRALAIVVRERGWTKQHAADEVGENRKTFDHWVQGRSLPGLPTAIRVAEALDRPSLAQLALEVRTKTCPVCDRTFVDVGLFLKGIYCSQRCNRTHYARKARGKADAAERLATRRLKLYTDTAEKHCRACSPEGICFDSTCAWQEAGLSPFKVDKRLSLPGRVA